MIGIEDSDVGKAIVERYEELRSRKSSRLDELDMVARLYRPSRRGFKGETRDHSSLDQLYNSATLQNANQASASLYSTLCNPANQWFKASIPDKDLAEWRGVKEWLDIVTKREAASFRPAVSNFYAAAVPWFADTSILGTGILVEDESNGRHRIRDRCVSPAKAVIDVDADGDGNELIIPLSLTPVQAARLYGTDNLPEKVRDKIEAKNPGTHTYLQAYQPNDEFTPGKIGRKGQEYLSTHVCMDYRAVVKQGGTYEQSFSIARWDTDDDDDPWGIGLGFTNLASALKLQIQEKQNQQAGAFAARPPIGTHGSRAAKAMKMAPGKYMHGAISHTGQQLVKPLFWFNGLPVTLDMAKQTIEEVERGWQSSLLTLAGRTGLGNLEVMERQEERLRLQAPYLGRMQSEGLATILERRFSLLFRAGQIPPPPPELKNIPLEIEYTSVAALAQRSQDGVAVSRILQDTAELAKVHPDPEYIWDAVDTDEAQRVLREAKGAPEKVGRSAEDIAARREARENQRQAEQAAQAAQQGVDIAGGLAALDQGAS